MIRKHCSRAVLNKAYLISNIRFSRYTNSHKHKHIQPFFFLLLDIFSILGEPKTLYVGFPLPDLCWQLCDSEDRRVWDPLLCHFLVRFEARRRTAHWWTHWHSKNSSTTPTQWDIQGNASVLCLSFTVVCVRHRGDESTWLLLPVLASIYSFVIFLLHCDWTKQLIHSVLYVNIYIFSIYSIYRVSLYSIYVYFG